VTHVQTFAPLQDATEIAKVLDYRRLGKQRVETKQLLMALLGLDKAGEPTTVPASPHTRYHPITRAWAGHEFALWQYGMAMCIEWIGRGYNSTIHTWFEAVEAGLDSAPGWPWWWGTPQITDNHQRMLVWKEPSHYATIWPDKAVDPENFVPGYWYPGPVGSTAGTGRWQWKPWADGD
jgi:hypothetical protein